MSASLRVKDGAVPDVPVPGLTATPGVMARMQAGLWAGGALLAVLVAILPHPKETFTPGFLGAAVVAGLSALVLRWRAETLPSWALQGSTLIGTVLITACIYFSGERQGAPATDNEMLYLWVAIYSAYFFTLRQATVQIVWVAIAYWVVLAVSADQSVFATRWAETVGTLALATVLVQALRNRISELVGRLADAARTDPLTGLRNRRGFEETFGTEVERARRHDRPLSVIVGDLDHFKQVNDRLGHPAGDAALVRVGELLRSGRRQIDPVARTGGEEFALILPEASEQDAYLVAERLREAVKRVFSRRPVPLTMSLGVATFPDHGVTADALLAAADRALYAAKQLGRNRAVVYSDEVTAAGAAREQGGSSNEVQLASLVTLAEALDLRYTGACDHSQAVGRYAAMIGRQLGLGPGHVARLEVAGRLHDVGKVGLPDSVLRKSGELDEEEWAQVRRHPEVGAEILGGGQLADVRSWVLAHHERPDGQGYPRGLSGEEIPLEARILAVAEAFESMTADRVYRSALGADEARAELQRCAGSQFDGRVVQALLAALDREAVELGGEATARS